MKNTEHMIQKYLLAGLISCMVVFAISAQDVDSTGHAPDSQAVHYESVSFSIDGATVANEEHKATPADVEAEAIEQEVNAEVEKHTDRLWGNGCRSNRYRDDRITVTFNPKFGGYAAFLSPEKYDIFDDGVRVGYIAGADFRIEKNRFFISPGFHYLLGTVEPVDHYDHDDDIIDKLGTSAFKVPLNIGYYLTHRYSTIRPYFHGGVTGNIFLDVKRDNNLGLTEDDFNKFYLGANIGFGLDIWLFNISVNYETGLSDYFRHQDGRNNVLTTSVGFAF